MNQPIWRFVSLSHQEENSRNFRRRARMLTKRERARMKLSSLRLKELQTFLPQLELHRFFQKAAELHRRDLECGLVGIPEYVYLLRCVPPEIYRIVKHTVQNCIFRKVKRYAQRPALVMHRKSETGLIKIKG